MSSKGLAIVYKMAFMCLFHNGTCYCIEFYLPGTMYFISPTKGRVIYSDPDLRNLKR